MGDSSSYPTKSRVLNETPLVLVDIRQSKGCWANTGVTRSHLNLSLLSVNEDRVTLFTAFLVGVEVFNFLEVHLYYALLHLNSPSKAFSIDDEASIGVLLVHTLGFSIASLDYLRIDERVLTQGHSHSTPVKIEKLIMLKLIMLQ